MKIFFVRITLLSVILWLCPALIAQTASAITGVVSDISGGVIPDATVTLSNPHTGVSYTAKTATNGSYRLTNVPPGPGYVETVAREGFATVTVNDLYLNVGITRTQNVDLSAGTNVKVEVSASAQEITLNTTDASIGNNFDVKLVNDLPVQNRNSPQVLFSLQPGIVNGAVTGARQDQNETTLDGMDVNDLASGQSNSGFAITGGAPVDSIQEFRGVTAGLISAVGTGSGGQFQLVTKSGTNSFHGNLNEYHRDTSTTANNWFNNNAVPQVKRPALIQNQFGGAVGGRILTDKLFFFADFNNSRIIKSDQGSRVVPLDTVRNGTIPYINNTTGCTASSRATTSPQCISTLTGAQIQALDPQHVGLSADLLSFVNSRYPHANDLSGGNGVTTGLYRFTTPTPDILYNYVGRVDYNLTPSQKLFARVNIARRDTTQTISQFPTDPITHPFQDRSYSFVLSHIWTITPRIVNQLYLGETVSKLSFPTSFQPSGTTSYTFGAFANPYASLGSQKRRIPVPEVRDDFNWTVGHHTLQLGGTFKAIKTNSNLTNDFNFATVGLGGNTTTLNASLRPTNLLVSTTARGYYDNLFAFGLGRVGAITSNYNYSASGAVLPQGGGAVRSYKYFQTELYFGDTWKATPKLTIAYGLRYQLYSVPYETHGSQSVQNTTFDSYFGGRVAQSAAGTSGNSAVPFLSYKLGGKANNGPDLYAPSYKDLGPRVSFAYNIVPKTVINGSFALVFDRTVINAVNFIQDQSSYLFQNNAAVSYGGGSATTALLNDPRLGTGQKIPAPPTAPAISKPYTPNVSASGVPNGLNNNLFNFVIDPTLRDPYSITFNGGLQQELPGHFVARVNYVGRLGRRLLAQADASQLVDFPEKISGQMLSTAFANLSQELRNGKDATNVTAQPWFERIMTPGYGVSKGYKSNTAFLADNLGSTAQIGDFADSVQYLASSGFIPGNVGLASQFAGNTYLTNKGSSVYHGLLVTLSKNMSHGLQFDFNYTYSNSIDNVSAVANSIASSDGTGFLCDARNTDVCRANSDFDVRHVITSDFVYDLPVGRGKSFAANAPWWLNEAIGGWSLSGIPGYRTGFAFNTSTGAFLAGYANNAPAIFNGDRGAVKTSVHKTATGQVVLFADQTKAAAAFTNPIGFTIGSRNNLRGPSAFTMDLGLAKTFPIIENRLALKFRADAFNVLNHPVFALPTTSDINAGSQFGQITTASLARVAQFALRLEF